MSIAGDAELRKRKSNNKMPQSTGEFSGGALQFYERSPTATPAQTRSSSPMLGTPIPHTAAETMKFMNDLREIASKNAPNDLNIPTQTLAMTSAGVVDGSVYVSTVTKIKYLAIYFFFNLGLTLYNKAVMIQVGLIFISSLLLLFS